MSQHYAPQIIYYDPDAHRPVIHDNTDGQLPEEDYHTCDLCDHWIVRDYRMCGNDVCLTELAKQEGKEKAEAEHKQRLCQRFAEAMAKKVKYSHFMKALSQSDRQIVHDYEGDDN